MEFILKSFKIDLKITRLANIHYFEFTPNYHTVNDSHEFCELVYVDKGSIEISSENYTGVLYQNQMILHGANQDHSLTCNEQIAPNIIIIGFECKSDALDCLTRAPLTLTEELQKMLAEIIKEARAVYQPPYNVPNLKNMKKRKEFAFGADQMIKNYLQIFFIKCLRLFDETHSAATSKKQSAEKTQIYEIKRYLDENYRQKITLEELCFLFNTNKTSLSVHFKQTFQKTIIEYLNALRIKRTKALLREGKYTLTQIADSMHMSSVHYLTALFKKHTGMTPTEYLRSVQSSPRPDPASP
ncbi:MAG: helix-turn-helix transcriptional regulator [Clostridia bacterium]|nr:helix-turn-helix transcriptional regulator [Clostridia bacterium]